MKWMPIETAPKDGTEFLAYDSRTKRFDVCCIDKNAAIFPTQFDGEYGPRTDEFGYDWRDITHWMPLPTAPTQSQSQA